MKREALILVASDTLRCVSNGSYKYNNKDVVLHNSRITSKLYRPLDEVHIKNTEKFATKIEVNDKTTLQATFDLVKAGKSVCMLNFASARKPGGGFINGSVAQEESLARTSNLYKSLLTYTEMYEAGKSLRGLYSDYIGYSGNISFFKNDNAEYLPKPIYANVITSAAVNINAISKNETSMVDSTMKSRINKILKIALDNNQYNLVLGAFGCGVFGNKPLHVANLFKEVLADYENCFETVTFAVYDIKEGKPAYSAFKEIFG